MVIPQDRVARKRGREQRERKREGLARELITPGRKHAVLGNLQASLGQELPAQQINENRRDVRRVAVFVHHSNFATKQESQACGKRIDVRSGYHGATAGGEELTDVFEEIDGALDVLDDFNGDDQIERRRTNGLGEISFVEVLLEEPLGSLIDGCVAIDGDDVESEGAKPLAHGAWACAEIESAAARGRGVIDNVEDEIMETGRCSGCDHRDANPGEHAWSGQR